MLAESNIKTFDAFTARQRLIINIGSPVVAASVRLISRTCGHETQGTTCWEDLAKAHSGAIVAVWHESIILAAYHYRSSGIHTLASRSFDGEWAARALRWLGILSVRGSSSNGGSQALRDLAAILERAGTLILAVDGPKGPRRVAKAGAAILAARTGAPIIPHAFAVRPAWRLRSWDQMSIPKPFAHIVSAYAPAIAPPANADFATVEETRLQVEASLNQLQQQAEHAFEKELKPAPETPAHAATLPER